MENEETKKDLESLKLAIQERVASLDEPVRNLLMSNEYIIKLSEIVTSHGLTKENSQIVEELTTNFLLGTIRPSEFEQDFIASLPNLTKDDARSLYNDIKQKILSSVWNIIEAAWLEDDENEKIFNELVELEDVPLPPNMQMGGVSTVGDKVSKELSQATRNTDLGIKTQNEASPTQNVNWENKIQSAAVKSPEVATRTESDRSIPRIPGKTVDPYREIPEE